MKISNKIGPVIIVGILLLLGIGGYILLNKYEDDRLQSILDIKIAQDKEALIQKDLDGAKTEIAQLQTDSKIPQTKQSAPKQITQPSNTGSASQDTYYGNIPISSVVQLFCTQNANGLPNLNTASSGSGTFDSSGSGLILTNAHVVHNDFKSTCAVFLRDNKNATKPIILFAKVAGIVNDSDAALLRPQYLMTDNQGNLTSELVEIPSGYVYPRKNSSCREADIKFGSKLVVVGYPAVGGSSVTLTDGIVSGFDGDYIKTSAKIEEGNSGGGAFMIPSGCWIGIPTASTVGNIESLGRILRWDN